MGPEAPPPSPSVIVSVAPTYAEILEDVRDVRLVVKTPTGIERDTVLTPRATAAGPRIRAVLRPDEGAVGTRIGLELRHASREAIFVGETIVSPETGWPFAAELLIHPVATLDVGEERLLPVGEAITLSAQRFIVFLHGATAAAADIVWKTSDPGVIRVSGDRAEAVAPGRAELWASWREQSDTMEVRVFPTGTIVVSDTLRTYFLRSTEILSDTFTVSNEVVGDVGSIEATVDTGAFPWLSATLDVDSPPAELRVEIEGSLLPEGAPPGEVVVSSVHEGVAPVVVGIDARRDPADAEEVTWSPLCLIGDSLAVPQPGKVGCADLRARAWPSGDGLHVVLEVQNLLGTRRDSLDTWEQFDIEGFGVTLASATEAVDLLVVRPSGSVDVSGLPSFSQVTTFEDQLRLRGGPTSAIVGCSAPGRASSTFGTCDGSGFTGHVRADFHVTAPAATLVGASATLQILYPGGSLGCGSGLGVCVVP